MYASTLSLAQDTLRVSDVVAHNSLFIPDYITVLNDKERKITFADIVSKNTLLHQKPMHYGHLGMAGDAWWIKLILKNDTKLDHTLMAEMQNLHLNKIELYIYDPNQNKIVAKAKTGDLLPFKNRPLSTREFVFDITIPKNTTYNCYFYIDNGFESISLPFWLHTPSSFAKYEASFISIFFIFFGSLLTMCLISLYIFINSNMKLFLFYSLFTISDLLWTLSNYGFAFQWLWPENPFWHNISANFFPITSFVLFIPFIKEYFEIKNNFNLINSILNIYILIGIVFIIFFPFSSLYFNKDINSLMLNGIWVLLISMFFIYSFIIIISIRNRPSKSNIIFSIGLILMMVGAIVNVIRELTPLPVNSITEHIGIVLLWIEILLSSYAIALNINTLLKERSRLMTANAAHQKELLKTEIDAQDRERKRLASDLHDDLGVLLSVAKIEAHKVKNQPLLIDILDDSIKKISNITHKIHPISVEQFGLSDALDEFLYNITNSVPFKLHYELSIHYHLSNEFQVHIFRIATELINNCIKHSKAENVKFIIKNNIINNQKILLISIIDDGIGLDKTAPKKGIGLSNIESRVQIMNGNLKIESTNNKGLSIDIEIILS